MSGSWKTNYYKVNMHMVKISRILKEANDL